MRNSTECRLWHHLLHLLGDLNLARPSPFSGDLCRDYLRRTSADSNSPSSSATTTNINCLENSTVGKTSSSIEKETELNWKQTTYTGQASNLHRSINRERDKIDQKNLNLR
ncbi:hypothetical protein LINGRAHAP2_LOCUS3893 [Linum grandiflorum]